MEGLPREFVSCFLQPEDPSRKPMWMASLTGEPEIISWNGGLCHGFSRIQKWGCCWLGLWCRSSVPCITFDFLCCGVGVGWLLGRIGKAGTGCPFLALTSFLLCLFWIYWLLGACAVGFNVQCLVFYFGALLWEFAISSTLQYNILPLGGHLVGGNCWLDLSGRLKCVTPWILCFPIFATIFFLGIGFLFPWACWGLLVWWLMNCICETSLLMIDELFSEPSFNPYSRW